MIISKGKAVMNTIDFQLTEYEAGALFDGIDKTENVVCEDVHASLAKFLKANGFKIIK